MMINQLSEREKRLLLLAGVILTPLLLFRLVVSPLVHLQEGYQKQANQLRSQVRQIRSLGEELQRLRRANPARRLGLNAQVARILRQTGVSGRANSTSQGAEGQIQRVLVQVDPMTLTETSSLIYQLEHLRPVAKIETLDIQKSFQDPNRLKLNLVVSSP